MKKINPEKDSCENWKQDFKLRSDREYRKLCVFCEYSLFGYCWLQEALAKNSVVVRALQDCDSAKQTLHQKLSKGVSGQDGCV